MAVDYGKTLNLPKTDFPMRGGLPEKEPQILEEWQKKDVYHKRLERNRNSGKKVVLHDGPLQWRYPYGDRAEQVLRISLCVIMT